MKGPQPVSYFAFGIGLFILITRSWKQIPGFVLAGIICVIPIAAWYGYVYSPGDEDQWAAFMRLSPVAPLDNPIAGILNLISETLPAALFAIAFFVARGFGVRDRLPAGFLKAMICYASAAAIVILFWPGGSTTRYFFPSILPMCVFGALGYDALAKRWPLTVAPGLLVTLGLACLRLCLFRHRGATDAKTVSRGANRRGAHHRAGAQPRRRRSIAPAASA